MVLPHRVLLKTGLVVCTKCQALPLLTVRIWICSTYLIWMYALLDRMERYWAAREFEQVSREEFMVMFVT
jgi:hypothetical protein